MKKKYVLSILIIFILSMILYVGLPTNKNMGKKAVLTKTCAVAQPDVVLKTDIFQSIVNFSIVRSLEWNDSQKLHNFPVTFLKSEFVGEFKKEKIIVAAGIPNTENDSDLYYVEILNDTSCKFVKYFKEDSDSVFFGLLNNPWYFLKSILLDSKNQVTIGYLKTLGFKILDKNGDEITLHTYPAISIQLKVKNLENCKDSDCDDSARIVEVKNIFKQFVIEDDNGNVVSKTKPTDYSLNDQQFPIFFGR